MNYQPKCTLCGGPHNTNECIFNDRHNPGGGASGGGGESAMGTLGATFMNFMKACTRGASTGN